MRDGLTRQTRVKGGRIEVRNGDSVFCLRSDDLKMPMYVWLMGSALKTRCQDYVYINCLLDSDTMNGLQTCPETGAIDFQSCIWDH